MINVIFISIWLAVAALKIEAQTNHSDHSPCKPGQGYENQVHKKEVMEKKSITGGTIDCINGTANEYFPCKNVALESLVSNSDLNGGSYVGLNDIWGWTDGASSREFALVGLESGTSFVDVSDPINPTTLGILPTHTSNNIWRDIKTYKNYAFIVSEAFRHGLQVFDLKQLVTASTSSYTTFSETAHHSGFGDAHNIFINEDSGYAFIVGSNSCSGGLYMMNINTSTSPEFVGCYSDRGYVHDVQCIIYDGPDLFYTGKEICFASDENKLDIIDVSSKSTPELISTFTYSGYRYVHQGWLTEDRKFFLLDDESDESSASSLGTTTYIVNVTSLQNPSLANTYVAATNAFDHNQYVLGNFSYQANYRAGLRILDLNQIEEGKLTEIAYFDTYADNDNTRYNGAWSNYPYFKSGLVVISDIEQGLFVVRPDLENIETNILSSTPSATSTALPTSFISTNPSIDQSTIDIFVSNIDAISDRWNSGEWSVEINVTVYTDGDSPINGVTVVGMINDLTTCVTRVSGQCTLHFVGLTDNFYTFQIEDLFVDGDDAYNYNSSKNFDLDGDSNGTVFDIEAPFQISTIFENVMNILLSLC